MELKPEQKAKIEVHLKASLKEAFLAGVELGKAAAENSENKIDDIVVPVLSGPAEEYVNGLIAGIKL